MIKKQVDLERNIKTIGGVKFPRVVVTEQTDYKRVLVQSNCTTGETVGYLLYGLLYFLKRGYSVEKLKTAFALTMTENEVYQITLSVNPQLTIEQHAGFVTVKGTSFLPSVSVRLLLYGLAYCVTQGYPKQGVIESFKMMLTELKTDAPEN